jgi:hypothetical protein
MSVGQMPRINAVVVVTPYSMFWEIKELVEALDRAATESNEPVLRMSVPQPCADGVEEGMKASELEHRKRLLRGIEVQQTSPPGKKGR